MVPYFLAISLFIFQITIVELDLVCHVCTCMYAWCHRNILVLYAEHTTYIT